MPVSRDLEKVVHRDVGEEPHRAATRKCYSCSLHCRSEQASAKLNVGCILQCRLLLHYIRGEFTQPMQ